MKTQNLIITLIAVAGIAAGGAWYLKKCKPCPDPPTLRILADGETIHNTDTTPIELLKVDTSGGGFVTTIIPEYTVLSITQSGNTTRVNALGGESAPECIMPAQYPLGPDGYYIKYNPNTWKFELYDYNEVLAPMDTVICTCSVPDSTSTTSPQLRIKIVTSGMQKFFDVRKANPPTAGYTGKWVSSAAENNLIKFVKNATTAWPPGGSSSPQYKIIGSDDDRDIDDAQTLSNAHSMIYANPEQDYVYLQYQNKGGVHVFNVGMNSPTNIFKNSLIVAKISALRPNNQKPGTGW